MKQFEAIRIMYDVKLFSSLFVTHHSVNEWGRPEETKQEFQAKFLLIKR